MLPGSSNRDRLSAKASVTARGRGRKNLGRGRSSLVIVNEGSGSFSGKPDFQVIISLIDRPVGYSLTYRINGLNEALRCASRLCLFVPVSVRVGWEPNKTSQALSLVRPFTN
ncbi:unnamed protein product [Vicia faba]|uniref:Uncharacterized protein n=1 Tax=Vicia faba TaxID=3906 RepID=A0AAV1A471_VICFA|nr:unnamed protein product [Vicia faba]